MLTHTQNTQSYVIKGSIAGVIYKGQSGSKEVVITIVSNILRSCHENGGHFSKG